jgi:hypothetical protein
MFGETAMTRGTNVKATAILEDTHRSSFHDTIAKEVAIITNQVS